jgi:hypothetical protein
MPLRIVIHSELFTDKPDQEVVIRDQLPVDSLIHEICREYNLSGRHYRLELTDGRIPAAGQTLEQVGVKTGDTIHFRAGQVVTSAQLIAENGRPFALKKQAVLIGRPNPKKQLQAAMLDIDLTSLDPDHSSSRPHARITQAKGGYYVESLNENNLAYVNNVGVPAGVLQPLKSGDWLRFGKVKMQFKAEDSV